MPDYIKIKVRRGSTADWEASNPVLELGEIASAMDLLPIEQLQLLDSGTSSLPCSPAQRVVLASGVDKL